MRTHYLGHDNEYRKRRAAGQPGWDTAEVIAENIAALADALTPDYVPKMGRALELGCGAGDLTLWLAAQGYDTYGVDIAPTAIAWAHEKAQARGLDVDFRVGDVRDLATFPDDFMDVVVDGHCFHCIIREDRGKFLTAARRVLKPGGVFHISTMCGDPVDEIAKTNYDSVTRCAVYGDIATRYFGLPEEIRAEVQEADFRLLSWNVKTSCSPFDQHLLQISAAKDRSVTYFTHSVTPVAYLYKTCVIMMMSYLGLGSNLGDRAKNIQQALRDLASLPTIRVTAVSSFYETAPVGITDQPDFVNAVAAIETSLTPEELLDAVLTVEIKQGRVRTQRWGPRVIDVDVLTYGNDRRLTPSLTLPHPRLEERAFVIVPLAEIAPNLVLPGQSETMKKKAERIEKAGNILALGVV